MSRRKPKDHRPLQDAQALWESAERGEYPQETPCEGGEGSSGLYIWDSTSKSPLKPPQRPSRHPDVARYHTILFYRQSILHPMPYVPRETPTTARGWYAPPISPLDCVYKRRTSYNKDMQICEVVHLPTGLIEVVEGKGRWALIRRTAEFRLAEKLVAGGLTCGRDHWLAQIKDRERELHSKQ